MGVEDDATITVEHLAGDVVQGRVVGLEGGIGAGLVEPLAAREGGDVVADELPLVSGQRTQGVCLDLAMLLRARNDKR